MTWENLLKKEYGQLAVGKPLLRTDPGGALVAPIAIVGLYPALTRTKRVKLGGRWGLVPAEVEVVSFQGSASAKELRAKYLDPLEIGPEDAMLIDLYPYFLANTARTKDGRTMAGNVEAYRAAGGEVRNLEPRPEPKAMVAKCRSLRGNAERMAHYFSRCRPALIITLGNEVAAYARKSRGDPAAIRPLLYTDPLGSDVFGWEAPIVHGAHPGALMRGKDDTGLAKEHKAWCSGPGLAEVRAAKARWRRR